MGPPSWARWSASCAGSGDRARPGTAMPGLVSSKLPPLESPDELQRRVEAASRYVPLADLALSPQCGFASTAGGNQLTVDDERRKLELVVGTASKIWG